MRATCLNMVYELAKRDERPLFIGSDLSPGLLDEMRQKMPDRWYMEGITEANVIGMAAGLAMEGYMPFVNTIATFITRRCYEQVAVDLCLHELPVRLIGNGGGLVYAPLGPTHLAIEDIAIMRALPNMTVTAVCDAKEMVRLMNCTLDWPNPIYIRLAKGGDPVVSRDENGFAIGKAIPMRKARAKRAIVLMATGVMTTNCLAAAELLAKDGIDISVVHFHTIKPLDEEAFAHFRGWCRACRHGGGGNSYRRIWQRRHRCHCGRARNIATADPAAWPSRRVSAQIRTARGFVRNLRPDAGADCSAHRQNQVEGKGGVSRRLAGLAVSHRAIPAKVG